MAHSAIDIDAILLAFKQGDLRQDEASTRLQQLLTPPPVAKVKSAAAAAPRSSQPLHAHTLTLHAHARAQDTAVAPKSHKSRWRRAMGTMRHKRRRRLWSFLGAGDETGASGAGGAGNAGSEGGGGGEGQVRGGRQLLSVVLRARQKEVERQGGFLGGDLRRSSSTPLPPPAPATEQQPPAGSSIRFDAIPRLALWTTHNAYGSNGSNGSNGGGKLSTSKSARDHPGIHSIAIAAETPKRLDLKSLTKLDSRLFREISHEYNHSCRALGNRSSSSGGGGDGSAGSTSTSGRGNRVHPSSTPGDGGRPSPAVRHVDSGLALRQAALLVEQAVNGEVKENKRRKTVKEMEKRRRREVEEKGKCGGRKRSEGEGRGKDARLQN